MESALDWTGPGGPRKHNVQGGARFCKFKNIHWDRRGGRLTGDREKRTRFCVPLCAPVRPCVSLYAPRCLSCARLDLDVQRYGVRCAVLLTSATATQRIAPGARSRVVARIRVRGTGRAAEEAFFLPRAARTEYGTECYVLCMSSSIQLCESILGALGVGGAIICACLPLSVPGLQCHALNPHACSSSHCPTPPRCLIRTTPQGKPPPSLPPPWKPPSLDHRSSAGCVCSHTRRRLTSSRANDWLFLAVVEVHGPLPDWLWMLGWPLGRQKRPMFCWSQGASQGGELCRPDRAFTPPPSCPVLFTHSSLLPQTKF